MVVQHQNINHGTYILVAYITSKNHCRRNFIGSSHDNHFLKKSGRGGGGGGGREETVCDKNIFKATAVHPEEMHSDRMCGILLV